MQRELTRMAAQRHDVLVVGGGIYGACIALEAARAGLRAAIIDAADFGAGTSSNSLRTLHGGLRHLQRLDWARMRESIRERREWLRAAPDLAQPLRFVLPTQGHGARGRAALRAALLANDLVSADRNRGVPPARRLPRGRILSLDELRELFPEVPFAGCNGAAVWYDALCLNTERLGLAVLQSAVQSGAQAANYVRALELGARTDGVREVRVRDETTRSEFALRGRVIVDATGPRVGEWLPQAARRGEPLFLPSKAFNLLLRSRPFADALALTVPAEHSSLGASATYFLIPWNGHALLGTRHLRCRRDTREPAVTTDEIERFIAEVNPLLGTHRVRDGDILGVFAGLLPEQPDNHAATVALQRCSHIRAREDPEFEDVVSVVGVKWTTARSTAQQAVKLVCRRLRHPSRRHASSGCVLDAAAGRGPPPSSAALAAWVVPDLPVRFADVLEAVRGEMAQCLADVVWRRTPLYLSEALARPALHACAVILARELRWGPEEIGAQVEQVMDQLHAFRFAPARQIPERRVQTTAAVTSGEHHASTR